MSEQKTDRVIIFDTTLRDGEQAPGASMTLPQKLKVASALQALRVDVIEAGFPAASPGDFEAVRAVARQVRGAQVCGLARAQPADIAKAWEALKDAEKPRLHVFLATSPIHRQFKLGLSKEQVLKAAVEAVKRARDACADVEFSPEDAARTEPEFLLEVVEGVVAAGASTVNIPDTVGYAMPAQFGALIAMLKKAIGRKAVISVHCHDDLGLATANSLAAVQEGARQVECTVNGVGERAGNCALEEIVMAIRTRTDFLKVHTNVRTEHLTSASRTVSLATGFLVARNKAVVGQNAFAHESGIHQHGMLKNVLTYEIMKPQDVGVRSTDLVLGKHSGRNALRERLVSLGYHLEAAELDKVFTAFKELADRKKEIYDGDLDALVEKTTFGIGAGAGRWQLVSIHAVSGTNAAPSAAVCLQMKDGRRVEDAAVGDGPVDAVFKSIERITGVKAQLRDFRIVSMTPGEDAQGEVQIEVEHEGRTYGGRGVSTDIVVGSAQAFLEVVNRIAAGRPRAARTHAEEEIACGAV